jgi:hypothetical protein
MSGPLVARGTNDKVHIQVFLAQQGAILRAWDREHSNLETEAISLFLNGHNIPAGQDPVWPLLLIRPKCPLLVVHDFEQVLDQLQPDDTVVGGAGIRNEVGAVGGGLRVELINELWVKDAVDAASHVSSCTATSGHTFTTHNGESSLGLRKSDRMIMYVLLLGYRL